MPEKQIAADDPITRKNDDLLDRWPTAIHLKSLIKQGSAVRIAVCGSWGEGKTSVLNLTATMLSSSDFVITWLRPWAVKDPSAVWLLLADAIAESMAKATPAAGRTERAKKWARHATTWIYGGQDRERTVEALPRVGKTLGGMAQLGRALALAESRRYIERIINRDLGSRRLVVFIDDLDRANPGVVPLLLLSLRETFSISGCAFVVAMDPDVIGAALTTLHAGWNRPRDFFEKVFDFEVYLQRSSAERIERLGIAELRRLGLGVFEESVRRVVDLLPDNPRRLKRLLRGLSRLLGSFSRHDPEEIPYLALILMEMLRTTAPDEAHTLLNGELRDDLAAGTTHMRGDTFVNEVIPKIEGLFPKEATEKNRFVRLCREFMVRCSFIGPSQLAYWARVLNEPPLVTAREVRALILGDTTAESLSAWLVERTASLATPEDQIVRSLLSTVLDVRGEILEAAMSSVIQADLEEKGERARRALLVLSVLISRCGGFGPAGALGVDEFVSIVRHCEKWVQLRTEGAQLANREQERASLLVAADAAAPCAVEILTVMKVFEPLGARPVLSPEARQLERALVERLGATVVRELRTLWERQGGIASLRQDSRGGVFASILFQLESGFYNADGRVILTGLADRAATQRLVQENFVDFLSAIELGIDEGVLWVPQEKIRALVCDQEVIQAVWRGALATPFQITKRTWIRALREKLVNAGAPGGALPLPAWALENPAPAAPAPAGVQP